MNRIQKTLLQATLLAVTVCALPALAGPDTYGLGMGTTPLTVNTPGTVINSYAQVTAPAAPGDTALVVPSTAGFFVGDLVMVMQMTGIVPEPPSGGPSPVDISNDAVGRWELARITSVAGTTMNLDGPLVYSYAANVTQVIRVREYTNVTITPPGTLTASPWNGSTGGVLAFLASGTVTNNNPGGINVSGRGFRGGAAVDDTSGATGCTGLDEAAQQGAQKGEGIAFTRFGPTQTGRGRVANGGAGGVCLLSGGGGGGNGGTGGQGGNSDLDTDSNRAVGGQGGAALNYLLLNRLVMGGGGGAGHVIGSTGSSGGAGGGILFIRGNALSSPSSIVANGATGGSTSAQDGASGGGGGGTIYLRFAGTATCGLIQAIGGTGGNANGGTGVGPGGGGGGGRVLLQRGSGTCTPTTASVNGSSAGVQQDASAPGGSQYGAQPGTAGSSSVLTTGFPATMPVPVVTTPANGSVTNDTTPTYSGTLATTAPAGTEVIIYVDGTEVARVVANGAGNWTFTPTAPLAEGSHTVSAVAINTAQAVQSLRSNTNTFTVDITPPPAPVVSTPANGSTTNDNTPTYTGTAEPGSTVTVYVDGNPVGTAVANGSGSWTFTPTTPLADGSHTVYATATDVTGNTSVNSNTNTFNVDATAPAAPVVSTPVDGARTNDTTPTYTGTAEANSTVTVYVDGNLVGTTVADASGNWTFTQPTALPEGSHAVYVTATDAAGNISPDSNTNTFLVDTTPPPTPVVFTPADGSVITDNTPTYTGSASGATIVRIFVDGIEIAFTTVTGGSWSYTQPTPLPDGQHTIMVIAVDGAGNTSPNSNTNTFIVDTMPPPAPVVLTPANGSTSNDNTPTYTGTAEANSTVTVYVDGNPVGTTTADASGNWTFTPTTPLADGQHAVYATATDVVGNVSPNSNTNTFTVDTVAPAAPVVVTPANGSTTSDNTPTYTGTAEPNSTVTVYVDGNLVGTTTANASGDWSFTPTTALPDGQHTVYATATDAANNVSPNSNTNTFIVDTTPPAAPVVLSPANGSTISDSTPTYTGTAEPGSTVTVYVDGNPVGTTTADASGNWTFTQATALPDGSHTVSATATDATGNTSGSSNTNTFTVDTTAPAAPVVVTPANGSTTNDSTPTYTGTAEPGSTVTVIVDGNPVGTTTANASGDWSFTPTTALTEGQHTVSATATDAAGNTSPQSNTNTFTVDLTAPTAPVVTTPADGAVLGDNTPTYTGTAEPGSTVTVYVDGNPVGTTTADASGNWTLTPTTGLSNGQHTVNATATDAAGNVSPQSNTNTFTVNATIPAAPVVTGPADNTVTNDNTPTFTGTAEPGSVITVILNGTPAGTTTADASGNWTFTPTTPLADGPYVLTVTATNNAGNVSPESNAVDFVVDTALPETEIVSGPSGDTDNPDATFDFNSNEAGVTYECSLDGGAYAPCSDPDTFEGLAVGGHTLSVRAKDAAGNVDPTPATATWNVQEDSQEPPNLNFRGGGCASTSGGPSALGLMGLAVLAALLARKRRV
ncbi:adventurous gliding motility protein AgmC [Hyalangium gracile]|uniref:adventurous gliding motility protein AgmC n=1 Tax=Hyalangium gracile TaxID=394092 RepID=UPI001CC97791|nr:Ig-like domain-containing protein [Hyalangium gracile]